MADEKRAAWLWRTLTDNQRLCLMNLTSPGDQQVRQSHTLVALRALDRLGLMRRPSDSYSLTTDAEALASWARERGYAKREGRTWMFHVPVVASRRKIEFDPLADLAREGLCASEIARRLGTSRQAVSYALQRHGLSIARRNRRLIITVTSEERAAIYGEAERRALTVDDYLRELCVGQKQALRANLTASTPGPSRSPMPDTENAPRPIVAPGNEVLT